MRGTLTSTASPCTPSARPIGLWRDSTAPPSTPRGPACPPAPGAAAVVSLLLGWVVIGADHQVFIESIILYANDMHEPLAFQSKRFGDLADFVALRRQIQQVAPPTGHRRHPFTGGTLARRLLAVDVVDANVVFGIEELEVFLGLLNLDGFRRII